MFDFQLVLDSLPLLLQGAIVTVKITAISVGLGLFFGLFIGIAQISQLAIFRVPAKVYVDFLRGTPLLVQIFMIYFALPMLIGTRIDPFIAAIVDGSRSFIGAQLEPNDALYHHPASVQAHYPASWQ